MVCFASRPIRMSKTCRLCIIIIAGAAAAVDAHTKRVRRVKRCSRLWVLEPRVGSPPLCHERSLGSRPRGAYSGAGAGAYSRQIEVHQVPCIVTTAPWLEDLPDGADKLTNVLINPAVRPDGWARTVLGGEIVSLVWAAPTVVKLLFGLMYSSEADASMCALVATW